MVGHLTPGPALAIIPARGGSKRFPRKNLAPLAGRPLLAYAIDAARSSGVFATVCVSSDDDEILDVARACGADECIRRSPRLASDAAQVKDVCRELLQAYVAAGRPYAAFAGRLPTSPLRTAGDVRAAYELFERERARFVMSLVRFQHPPQRAVRVRDGHVEPFMGGEHMKQAQQLEPLYRHDGAVIVARTDAFLDEGEFYGTGAVPFYMSADRSVDIDSPLDLEWAEFLLTRSRSHLPA